MDIISNPINVNQLVGIDVDLKCLVPCNCGECKKLNEILQLLIDDSCKDKIDFEKIDWRCLTKQTSTQELIQEIIRHIDCSTSSSSSSTTPSDSEPDISGLNLCDSDLWTCSYSDNCLPIKDNCNNSVVKPKVKDVLQSIIKRILSIQKQLISNCNTITQLEQKIAAMELKINQIESNCCNTTLLNRVTMLESQIIHIQETCC